MDMMKNPLIAGLIGSILVILTIIIDNKYHKINRDTKSYIRLTVIITGIIVFMMYGVGDSSSSECSNIQIGRSDF